MNTLLLITDDTAVLSHVPWLDGDVLRCATVGEARRFLAREPHAEVGMIAWGPDVVAMAEEHWRLEGGAVAGVPQPALQVPGAPKLSRLGMRALGLDRIVQLPEGMEGLNAEVWGVESPAA